MAELNVDQLPDDPQVLREMILAQRAEYEERAKTQQRELEALLKVERELSDELRAELDRMRAHLAYLLRKGIVTLAINMAWFSHEESHPVPRSSFSA